MPLFGLIKHERFVEVLVEPGHNISSDEIDSTITYLASIVSLATKNDICWPFLETAARPRGKVTGSLTMSRKEFRKLKELLKESGSAIQVRGFRDDEEIR